MNTNKSKLYEGKSRSGAGSGSGGDSSFNGQRPITRQTPGLIEVNPDATTVIEMLENVFYPPTGPVVSLSIDNPLREIGDTTAYTLTWSVTRKTNPITGITLDGTAIAPNGGDQNGTQSGNVFSPSGEYIKAMNVTDGTFTVPASVKLSYLSRMFWGTTAKDGKTALITDADILALQNSDLKKTLDLELLAFGGGAQYLIFAIPSELGTPSFKVNGLANTAFTCVRTSSNFINALGTTVQMDVWVSDNLYNSPLDTVILY